MKALHKYISALCALLTVSQLFVVSAFAARRTSLEYIGDYTECIGVVGTPVYVAADGSYTILKESGLRETVTFGVDGRASASYPNSPYPVITRSYSKGDLDITLTQFADRVKADDGAEICTVFTRLTAENTGEKSVSFPSVSASAKLLSAERAPASVDPGEKATAEYYTPCAPGTVSHLNDTFDSRLAQMAAYWDSVVNESFTVKNFPDEKSYSEYASRIIANAIDGSFSGNACYLAALDFKAKGESDLLQAATEYAKSTAASLKTVGDGVTLVTDENGTPDLCENLEALVTLKSYSYICTKQGDTKGEKSYSDLYSKLLSSVEAVMKSTEKKFSCNWTAVTCEGDGEKMLFALCGDEMLSAKAMSAFYVCSAQFPGKSSAYLNSLGEGALEAVQGIFADVLPSSLVYEGEDGGIVIGKGCPLAYFKNGAEFGFDGFSMSDGKKLSADVSVTGNEISVTVFSEEPVAVTVALSVCRENIQYASCGFDYKTGIVTAPAGVDTIVIRLEEDTETVIEDKAADTALNSALFAASLKNSEICTSVSKDIFEKAYNSALSATAGTAKVKLAAAEELMSAVRILSPMTAEYTFTFSDGAAEGTVSADSVMQKFTAQSDGTLRDVVIGGEYTEGVFAAVYTLRKDGYTTNELIDEADGEAWEGGIKFTFDAALSGGEEYVLCVYSEKELPVLNVLSAPVNKGDLYIRDGGDETVYSEAALSGTLTVIQADRTQLDTFYKKCASTDTTGYTKESVNRLNSAMKKAKELLCTPSVTESEAGSALENLKKAHSALETYASDSKEFHSTTALAILIGASVLLLGGVGGSIIAANIRRNKKDKDLFK